jgi:hypothetical protein
LIASCGNICRARLLVTGMRCAEAGAISSARIDQPVMDQDVSGLQRRDRTNGQ